MPEKQNSQDYFLRSVGATNPKIVKLVLINTCHVQSTMVFQHLRAIICLRRFGARELRELVKVNLYVLKSLIKFQSIVSPCLAGNSLALMMSCKFSNSSSHIHKYI